MTIRTICPGCGAVLAIPEIERLTAENARLREQLAASQAREAELREAINSAGIKRYLERYPRIKAALSHSTGSKEDK